jgi:[ribosomal protein S5]-alanine N-acetyltransferase
MTEAAKTVWIETDRLWLRPLTRDDLCDIHRIWNDAGVRRFLWDDKPVSLEMAEGALSESVESFACNGTGLWCFALKGEGATIGFCGFRYFDDPVEIEVLYGLLPEHWNRGFASEATSAMLRYGFEGIKLDRIYAGADPPNQASFRVMEKVGMRFAKRMNIAGLEAIYYAVAREDFKANGATYILRRAT